MPTPEKRTTRNANRSPHEEAHSGRTPNRAPRATKAEVEARLAAVSRWIADEGVTVAEAVRRLQDAHGLGWRQALRYWTRARKR